ncbi:MAG TPA: Ig-like domain-containing protein, partial [Candidatus Saccharimonadales bacterium]|nr:Ig-like domain-containing protein [Candidatus Saccharimonadales bacterium]
ATYAVAAVNGEGEGQASTVTQPEALADFVIYVYWPDEYYHTVTSTNAILSWTINVLSGADGMLELGTSPTNFDYFVGYDTNYALWHTFNASNLTPTTVYYYRLTTVGTNRGGFSYVNYFATTYPNRPPTADDVYTGTWSGQPVTISLSGSDPDFDWLTGGITDPPTNGTLSGFTFNGWNGSVTYTPNTGVRGLDHFTYSLSDGSLFSAPAVVTIDNFLPYRPPVIASQSLTNAEDNPITIILLATDPEGGEVTFYTSDGPTPHGTLDQYGYLGTNNVLVYTPAPNYNGQDSFTVYAYNAQASASATISLTITPVNDAPSANAQSLTTAEDTALNIILASSDPDGDTLTFSIVTAPAHGTLSGTGANRTYTPAANYNGPDNFTFKVNDGTVDSAPATVSLTVTPVNDSPSANGQSVSTPYNTAVSITLTGSDPDGSALTFTVLTSPANGTLSGTAPNLTFTPTIGWSGTTSFTFRVNDGALNSSPATVIITVNAATSIPAAPSGLSATAVSSSQINLAWTDTSANEDGFKIERSNNGSSWSQIATVGPNTTTYSSTGLSANKTYYYRVRAYNVLGNSAYSNTSSAKTLH